MDRAALSKSMRVVEFNKLIKMHDIRRNHFHPLSHGPTMGHLVTVFRMGKAGVASLAFTTLVDTRIFIQL